MPLATEKLRLSFLRKCRILKRPPPSLRVSGANALSGNEKLMNLSITETRNLDIAIGLKVTQVKEVTLKVRSDPDTPKDPLPKEDVIHLKQHYLNKSNFYESQNHTKWKDWPQKTAYVLTQVKKLGRTNKNFKKKTNSQQRKTEKQAIRALKSGSVILLTEDEVPAGAIALLGKGLGYIPTPKIDKISTRLDMRLLTNKLLNQSNFNLREKSNVTTDKKAEDDIDKFTIPQKLRRKVYTSAQASSDNIVNESVKRMSTLLDDKLRDSKDSSTSNLSTDERKGLKWLQNRIDNGSIAITKADKGGATLIVTPQLLYKKTMEKLQNDKIYQKLQSDPTKDLHKELYDLWVQGKNSNYVTPKVAKDIMGISDNIKSDGSGPTNQPSTLPHFKPGIPYFSPSLKIHKLDKADLIPGVEPPIRLITALQEGVTRRSDVYIASEYLKSLERDFCGDLLKDTNDALAWLDYFDSSIDENIKRNLRAFSFDFKALYDSLQPELAKKALSAAIDECRPDWSPEFKNWIMDLVDISFRASVGKFDGEWYQQKNGVPTGGSLCVQIANISVYHYLRELIYSDASLMEFVTTVKRFIDDGSGFFSGTKEQFSEFITKVNEKLSQCGLYIDEYKIAEPGEYLPFLDIQFCFDNEGQLQTDLFVKQTDARSYLFYGSAHPNHVYSGIVYSQCLRLRRIINCDTRLSDRIDEMKICFFNAEYPKRMVENISQKVKAMVRIIPTPANDSNSSILVPETPGPPAENPVRVISTFGCDSEMIDVVRRLEPSLISSKSFSSSESFSSTESEGSSRSKSSLFTFVRKTGTSLRSKLVKVRHLTQSSSAPSKTVPCKHRNCGSCKIISDAESHEINDHITKSAPGNCSSYNVVYIFICNICDKNYVGRTVQKLRERVNNHRSSFYRLLNNPNLEILDDDDTYSLGAHLIFEHGCSQRSDFNDSYKVFILMNCSPSTLEYNEHKYIQRLRTIKPFGINSVDPFGIPLLDLG